MQYWLMKSEPDVFSIDDLKSKKYEPWDGVRNYQARNFMQGMKVNDLFFFYHTGEVRAVVGIGKVVKEHYPDPTDEMGAFSCVDVTYQETLKNKVALSEIKANPALSALKLVTHSRLSVMPVSAKEWGIILKMSK
jgi:predicted RNA-binding protein with PUA-like domain